MRACKKFKKVCGLDPQSREIDVHDRSCVQIAKLLKEKGADLTHQDNYGLNAVSMAAVRGHYRMCTFLIQNGVPFNIADIHGRTPIMMAAAHGYVKVFDVLITRHNAYTQLTTKDNDGLTCLHHSTVLAINNGSYISSLQKIVNLVTKKLNLSLDVAVDNHNRTALMYAAMNNNLGVLKVLLTAGSDVRLVDSFGVSVMEMTRDADLKAVLLESIVQYTISEHEKWLNSQQGDL